MKQTILLLLCLGLLFTILTSETCQHQPAKENNKPGSEYVCLPCGSPCDTIGYSQGGACAHCNMTLVEKSGITHTSIEPGQLCSFVETQSPGEVLLLDVRTPPEFAGTAEAKFGRLKNAINIPVQELEKRMGELEAWKSKKVVVYCSHSYRSPRAAYLLTQNGFKDVINLNRGMSVWKQTVPDPACNESIYVPQWPGNQKQVVSMTWARAGQGDEQTSTLNLEYG